MTAYDRRQLKIQLLSLAQGLNFPAGAIGQIKGATKEVIKTYKAYEKLFPELKDTLNYAD